jgi:hypothetical protein
VLKTLIDASPAELDTAGVLRLVPALQSDHYRGDVLSALLSAPQLTERDLLGVVAAAAPMSDHYESVTLRQVLGHRGVTDRVRAAALDSAGRLSSHYADAVRRAARR